MSLASAARRRVDAPKSASVAIVVALTAVVLLAPTGPLAAQAQEGVAVEQHAVGSLTIRGAIPFDGDVTSPARRRAANATIDRLIAVLRADPGVAHPAGYDITANRVMGRARAGYDVGAAYHAGLWGNVWQIASRGDGHGGREVVDAGKLPFALLTNTAWCDGEYANAAPDGGPPILEGVRQTGQLHGHPVYDGKCILITARPVPAFVPVTRERYLRIQVRQLEAQAAKTRKDDKQMHAQGQDPRFVALFDSSVIVMDSLVGAAKAQLDSLTPPERSTPAWVLHQDAHDSSLVDPGTAGAAPLMSENPALFDATLPPDQPQVIALLLPFAQPDVAPTGFEEDPERRANVQAIVHGLDWAALEAMVRP